MEELLNVIVKALVSNPDEVKIESIPDAKGEVINLYVAKEDMGKIIGKGGRIARAIRSVVKAAASKEDKQVRINIEE